MADLFGEQETEQGRSEISLNVNKEYARRFKHNKEREDLHRLQNKYTGQVAKAAARASVKGLLEEESDESSDETEDDGYISPGEETQVLQTLAKLRKRDASIYDKDTQFYFSEEEEAEDEAEGTVEQRPAKKAKTMVLRQVIAQQALHQGPLVESDEEGEQQEPVTSRTYDQEQAALKHSFLEVANADPQDAADGEDFESGILKKRAKPSVDVDSLPVNQKQLQQALADAFGPDDQKLSEADRFLKQYISKQAWADEGDDGEVPMYGDVVGNDSEDEDFLDRAEQFEKAYNFRFEEPGAASLVSHPRQVQGSVRKNDDSRKRQRQAKAERQAEEAAQRQEELKRLKNLKRADIEARMQRLQAMAGAAGPDSVALDALLEGDFDPAEYDKRMEAAFGDDYYDGAEEEAADLLEAQLEAELSAAAGLEDEQAPTDAPAQRQVLGRWAAGEGVPGLDAEEVDEAEAAEGLDVDTAAEEGQPAGPAEPAAVAEERSRIDQLLAEYYKLDYEDEVAGIKTRFRYRHVPRAKYGLSTADILELQDKELNQVIGLKRIAPYRPDEGLVRPNYGKLHELKALAKAAKGSKRREPAQGELQAGAKGAKGSKLPGQQGPPQPTPWEAHTNPALREEGSAKPAHKKHEKLRDCPATSAAQAGKGPSNWRVEQKPPAAKAAPAKRKEIKAAKPLSVAERATQRLQSYAAPTLAARHPPQDGHNKKRKRPQQQQLQPQEGSQLPKAARKNLRRKMKRQALSAAAEQAAT